MDKTGASHCSSAHRRLTRRSTRHGWPQHCISSSAGAFMSATPVPHPPCRVAGFRFMQDGPSPHRADSTIAWLDWNKARHLNGGMWLRQSPDMNPIENISPLVPRKINLSEEELWSTLQSCVCFHFLGRGKGSVCHNAQPFGSIDCCTWRGHTLLVVA